MPVYGYKRADADQEPELLDLREVTFAFPAGDHRRIAAFLLHYADQIDSGLWRSDHAHLDAFDTAWSTAHPGTDLVVLNPDPEPPPRVMER